MWWALAYLYVGFLFAEVTMFGLLQKWWVYGIVLFTWPVLIPVVIFRFHKGRGHGTRK